MPILTGEFNTMNLSLTGLNAVVCGSTQGIGLAIAKELSAQGARCFLIARNEPQLQYALTLLSAPAELHHEYRVADFYENDQVKKAIDSIVGKHPVHILINNTGGPPPGPVAEATTAGFEHSFRQHLVNNQLLSQAVLPGMKAAGYGRIINILSISVKSPIANLGVSNTIRAAVAAWAKTLSLETGRFNITVNNVLPGSTRTGRLERLLAETAKKRNTDIATLAKEMEEQIPMKRFGLPEEIANVVAFLASPAASFVNGVSIPVDGGQTGTL